MLAWRARLCAETGLWSNACDDAAVVLGAPRRTTISCIVAGAALGLVHVRRGDADALAILDEALRAAQPTREPQRLVPILTARAELAWLTGRPEDIAACIDEGVESLSWGNRSLDRERGGVERDAR